MSRTVRPKKRPVGQCRPKLERLEARLALSLAAPLSSVASISATSNRAFDTTSPTPLGPNLSVVATYLTSDATLGQAPVAVNVTFDRPLNPNISTDDILIEQFVDGNWILAHDAFSAPSESLGRHGTQLILTPNPALKPGSYQLVLPGSSLLQGSDGSTVDGKHPDQVFGQFTIAQPDVTLARANDLKTIGSEPVVKGGSLDLSSDLSAFGLYKFDLAPGHHWRLGAEVLAQLDGSPLASALTLFDAQGQQVATSTVGLPDAPNNSYLFEGLDPGVYYLRVSGQENVPGTAGGYDPSNGTEGTVASGQSGEFYQLSVVADPADTPTRLIGASVRWDDPLQNSPTGISLTFDGALNLDTLRGEVCKGLELIGQDGQIWSLTAVGDRSGGAFYSFVFNEPLPVGHYLIRLPARNGVTDLAGYSPVAPGEETGVLARFAVGNKITGARAPNDLGPLYPSVVSGLKVDDVIQPGTAVAYRFVALTEGFYSFPATTSGENPVLQLIGPDGVRSFTGSDYNTRTIYLKAGVYELQFANPGPSPLRLTWSISVWTDSDSLLNNGIGQGPALNLRLVNPTATGFSASEPFTAAGPAGLKPVLGTPGTTDPVAPTTPGSAASSGAVSATPSPVLSSNSVAYAAPAGLSVTLGNTPVGRPSTEAEHVAVVGPGVGESVASLASFSEGLPPGIGYRPSRQRKGSNRGADTEIGGRIGAAGTDSADEGVLIASPEVPTPGSDDLLIAAADWITRLRTSALDYFTNDPEFATGLERTDPGDTSIVFRAGDDAIRNSGRVEQAQIGAPLVVGLLSVAAARYQPWVRRWLHRKRNVAVASQMPRTCPGEPVSRRFPRVRA